MGKRDKNRVGQGFSMRETNSFWDSQKNVQFTHTGKKKSSKQEWADCWLLFIVLPQSTDKNIHGILSFRWPKLRRTWRGSDTRPNKVRFCVREDLKSATSTKPDGISFFWVWILYCVLLCNRVTHSFTSRMRNECRYSTTWLFFFTVAVIFFLFFVLIFYFFCRCKPELIQHNPQIWFKDTVFTGLVGTERKTY